MCECGYDIPFFDACNHGVSGFNVLSTIKEDMLDRFVVETTGTKGVTRPVISQTLEGVYYLHHYSHKAVRYNCSK